MTPPSRCGVRSGFRVFRISRQREAKLTLLDSNEGFASRLIGTPDTILLRMQDFHHLGIDCFLLSLHDKLFNREVLPALRHF